MTTIVGIFDSASDVDKVVERVAAAGFDGTVYDEAIVAEEPGSIDPARPILAGGSAPEVVLGSNAPNLILSGTSIALFEPLKPTLPIIICLTT